MSELHERPRILGHFGFALMLGIAALWAATARSLKLTGGTQAIALLALGLACTASPGLRLFTRRDAWAAFTIAAIATGIWHRTITPSQDRDQAPDVAHGISADLNGPTATLHDIRNFAWTSDSQAIPAWHSRSYNINQITSVDMTTSAWGNPDIAHVIVRFGFQDNQHVAFSVEIRHEKTGLFSTIAGVFRQLGLVLIAVEKSDVIKVRTIFRREDVHLYPKALPPEHRRSLFLTYLDLGNRFAAIPEFDNPVSANCTSTVYRLVKAIKPDMPMHQRRATSAVSAKALSGKAADFLALIRSN